MDEQSSLLPNANLAFIDPAKVRDYLLCDTHPVGRFKSAFFHALGFTQGRWEDLRDEFLRIAHTQNATAARASTSGSKYVVDGILNGPRGKNVEVRTIWIVSNDARPRFVTAYPR
ncbi:MAG: DUF6883 domain-containing protein [Burkholderiales bacterium]